MQIADGVDDDTWLYHLRAGDYSLWFHEGIKDDALAEQASLSRPAHGTEKRAEEVCRIPPLRDVFKCHACASDTGRKCPALRDVASP